MSKFYFSRGGFSGGGGGAGGAIENGVRTVGYYYYRLYLKKLTYKFGSKSTTY